MEVEVRPRRGGELDIGMPRMLFSYRLDDSSYREDHSFYDVLGAEERFILSQALEPDAVKGDLMLVVPWWAELETSP